MKVCTGDNISCLFDQQPTLELKFDHGLYAVTKFREWRNMLQEEFLRSRPQED
ncbi:MAG TPA: hypothetical protein VJ036_01300 [bacterium]|nr:hypothetical protein [bacterium]